MRRIMVGLLVASAMGCGVEGYDDVDDLDLDEIEIDERIGGGLSPAATVKLTSWHDGTEVVSKAWCESFTSPDGLACSCNEDPMLVGTLNVNNGSDKCLLCRSNQWGDDTCTLTTSRPVDVELNDNGTQDYSYLLDGVEQDIDETVPWRLGYDGPSCTCDPTDPGCSCGDGFLDFMVDRTLGTGGVEQGAAIIRLTEPLFVSARVELNQVETRLTCRDDFSVTGQSCTCDAQGLTGTVDGDECVVCSWGSDLGCSLGSFTELSLVFTTSVSMGLPNYTYRYDDGSSMVSIPTDVPWVLSTQGNESCSCAGLGCGCTATGLDFEAIRSGVSPMPNTQKGGGLIGT